MMMKEFYQAMAAAKKELGPTIHVDAKGQYGSYASLEQVLKIIEPVAQAHGLLILQYPDAPDKHPALVTRIVHIETEQWIQGTQLLVSDKPGPQGLGAAETYARRRGLMDFFGLATEDDVDAAKPATTANRMQPLGPHKGPLTSKLIPLFKKYAGKTYGEVPLAEHLNSADWLRSEAKKKGEALSGKASEYCTDVMALQLDAEVVPPTFSNRKDEDVPF